MAMSLANPRHKLAGSPLSFVAHVYAWAGQSDQVSREISVVAVLLYEYDSSLFNKGLIKISGNSHHRQSIS